MNRVIAYALDSFLVARKEGSLYPAPDTRLLLLQLYNV